MASKQAISRLRKELKSISADPPPHIHVACSDANILNWSYLLEGPAETPYEGGWYWGRLKIPGEYPFGPPSIIMVTPSGRFETNIRLCLSMSDYHPESWNPAWSLSTVLKGLLSFMCEESPTAGAIDPPPPFSARRALAASSLEWNKAQADFLKVFPEVDRIVAEAEARRPPQAPPRQVAEAAAADAEEAGAEAPLKEGDMVRIHGLKARPDLNGQEGVVEAQTAEVSAGRVQVRVAGESVALKPDSLERLQGAAQ
mmetsp:Transcript_18079/g.39727  ORF Transcript_18079/g.39727 Transcript_18079/m.39727 type:complete len:256 (-) Transcript_18079:47-814(-)